MRILFSAPRKTGNAYLRCLLAAAFGLEVAGLRNAPSTPDSASLAAWTTDLPDNSVTATSLSCSPDLRSIASARNITLLGVIRHPCDLFLSDFEVAQQKAARGKGHPDDEPLLETLAGHELDDPAVLHYARNGFSDQIAWLRAWHDHASATIRYEQLLAAPAEVLATLSSTLGPLGQDDIARAIDLCQAENLVISRPARGRRMPAVPPGAWRERLPLTLQSILRERYADDIAYLGYDPA